MGSILLDAMEYSLPVIATSVGGIPRIVTNNENGFLIDVDCPDQLAERILWLKSDISMRERMGQAGRRMAAGHTPPEMASAYMQLYRTILQR
jgi:glycosyltransferase involved in cell wall biosynthesis